MGCGCQGGFGGGAAGPATDGGGWIKKSFTYLDFAAAATINSITLYPLLAREVFSGYLVRVTTPFSGPGIDGYWLEAGLVGDLARYAPLFNSFTGAPETIQENQVLSIRSYTAAVNLIISAVSHGANLNAATAGAVDVDLYISRVPA
jgi:hypothetical protein